jgi:hypothetical protein
MLSRIKAYSLIGLLILTGCAASPTTTASITDNDVVVEKISEEEYAAIVKRIDEEAALAKELEQNLRDTEERTSSDPVQDDSVVDNGGSNPQTKAPEAADPKNPTVNVSRQVASRAYQSVISTLNSSSKAAEEQVITSETIGNSYRSELLSAFSTAVDAWDEYMPTGSSHLGVFFTNNSEDLAWADEMADTYGAPGPPGGWSSFIKSNKYWSGPDCGPGDATPRAFYMCVSSKPNFATNAGQKETIIHEYFHLVHLDLAKTWRLPMWITEGSATYFGRVLGAKQTIADRATEQATEYLAVTYGFGWDNVIKNISKDEFVDVFTELESLSTNDTKSKIEKYNAYLTGGLAVEYLIGTYGYDEFMTFLSDIGTGITWQESFSRHYGSRSAFYDTMYTYLKVLYK